MFGNKSKKNEPLVKKITVDATTASLSNPYKCREVTRPKVIKRR